MTGALAPYNVVKGIELSPRSQGHMASAAVPLDADNFAFTGGVSAPAIAAATITPFNSFVFNETGDDATFTVHLPLNYDDAKDKFRLRVIAKAGTAATGTIAVSAATLLVPPAASATSLNLAGVSAVTLDDTTNVKVYTITMDSLGLKPGGLLGLTLAYTSNSSSTAEVYGVEYLYSSNIALTDTTLRL